MVRNFFVILLTSLGLSSGAFAANEASPTIGVVNFANCVTESKLGKQEQASFESLKKQMSSLLEDTEKQLNEINAKFNDPEYLDGLSPEAEEELKNKFRSLNEEMGRYQNQYYQVLNQANMRIVQLLGASINSAAEKVAKEKHLSMVINKEAFFFFAPQLEVTPLVIAEMDKTFDIESKKQAQASAPSSGSSESPSSNSKNSEAKVK
jgi:outer membrane protein